jgi:hypothetical protein
MNAPPLSIVGEQVRGTSPALVADITASIEAMIAGSPRLSRGDLDTFTALATHTVDAILTSLGSPASPGAPRLDPPDMAQVPADAVRDVCELSTSRTWQALVGALEVPDSHYLLQMADRVFNRGYQVLVAALYSATGRSRPGVGADTYQAIAHALLCGDDAQDMAAAAGVRLSDAYIVLAVGRPAGEETRASDTGWLPQHLPAMARRRDILHVVEAERVLALVPAAAGVQRPEVRKLALRGMHDAKPEPMAAAAPAQSHKDIPGAVDEANAVMHVVRALGHPPALYLLDDVPLEVSLMRSPDLAERLALRLTPLYGSGAPLLETLQIYLDSSQDRRQTARALHIHPNTLDYRLRRIRELTGLSVNAPRDIQLLGAATTAWCLLNLPDA